MSTVNRKSILKSNFVVVVVVVNHNVYFSERPVDHFQILGKKSKGTHDDDNNRLASLLSIYKVCGSYFP